MEKVICMVSGGIDSPVAAALAAKEAEIIPLHFNLYPFYCESSFSLTTEILKHLQELTGFKRMIVFPWGNVLSRIHSSPDSKKYACVLCRHGMLKAAEYFCVQEGACGIVTGESLGQKASQTLENMYATSSELKFPIFRPLFGLDKVDIERISRKIGVWSDKHVGCCSATPEKPTTAAKPDILEEYYSELELQKLIESNLPRAFIGEVSSPEALDGILLDFLDRIKK